MAEEESPDPLQAAARRLNNLIYRAARGGAAPLSLDIIFVQGPGIDHPIPQISLTRHKSDAPAAG